jgi:adenylate cyclase
LQDAPSQSPPGLPRPFSLQRLLPLALGTLMLLALLPVMAAGFFGARDNTTRLLRTTSDAIVDGLEDQLRRALDPVAKQMALVAAYVASGQVDPADSAAFGQYMTGVVTGQSNAVGIGFLEAQGPFRAWTREKAAEAIEPRDNAPYADEIWTSAVRGDGPVWHRPFVSRITRSPVLLHRQPVMRDGKLLGVFMTAITSEAISSFVMNMDAGITPFVIFDGGTVLVHPNLRSVMTNGFALPMIDGVNDPALAVIWKDPRKPAFLDKAARSDTHWSWVGDGYTAYQYYYREIRGYGADSWFVGFHQNTRATLRERLIVQALLYGSGLVLVLVMAAAWYIGLLAARPANAIAHSARELELLHFAKVEQPALEASRILEVRDTAHALGRAALALKRFQTYVPRVLIQQLMTLGDDRAMASDRDVTILFMDMAGYTAFSNGRSAEEVGQYLNGIFAAIGPIIEGGGGTIDKYTGDGLLAVWGAPTDDPDHARHAWEAALAVRQVMTPLLDSMMAADPRSCRMRIGLHSGRVLAGDLGFEGRMDYTVVGRTVNVAQRTQAALKPVMGDDLVVLGISETTRLLIGLPLDSLQLLAEAPGGEMLYRVPAEAAAQTSPMPSRAIKDTGHAA